MTTVEIKKLSLSDLDQLQRISIQTFIETYSSENTKENIKTYLDQAFSTDILIAELRDKNVEFYFAILDNIAIGYIKLNFGSSQTELKEDCGIEIERIYVTIEYHGKNVGRLLCGKAIERAKEKNADYVWLGVWEENLRAINFYKKNGFVEFDKHGFKLGNAEQTDLMMKLKLSN
ncbi:MAG: GNAT family N-acetyltransferase [Saprospiraceae bacterium]